MDTAFGASGNGNARPPNGGAFYGKALDVEMFPDGDVVVFGSGGHNVRFNIPPANLTPHVQVLDGTLTIFGTPAMSHYIPKHQHFQHQRHRERKDLQLRGSRRSSGSRSSAATAPTTSTRATSPASPRSRERISQ
jgi:hypothetical protein